MPQAIYWTNAAELSIESSKIIFRKISIFLIKMIKNRFKVKKKKFSNIFSQNFKSRLRMRRWPLEKRFENEKGVFTW